MTDISSTTSVVDNDETCDECQEEPFKYKCPGCMARTCSLACSKAHKEKSGCTGKRRREQFVSINEYNENTMMSDYWLLEDITGVAEGAERARAENRKTGRPGKNEQRLISAAKRASVTLILMSEGMLRRKQNSSRFVKGSETMKWHLELRFVNADVVHHEKCVPDSHTLLEILEAALVCKPGTAKLHLQLDAYVQASAQGCCMFLQRERVPASQQRLQLLTSTSTLREALTGACIIEFPVLHVYLASEAPQIT